MFELYWSSAAIHSYLNFQIYWYILCNFSCKNPLILFVMEELWLVIKIMVIVILV